MEIHSDKLIISMDIYTFLDSEDPEEPVKESEKKTCIIQ
jgi:hypothetical protein